MKESEVQRRLTAAEQHITALRFVVSMLLDLSSRRTRRIIWTAVYAALHAPEVARQSTGKGELVRVYQQLLSDLQQKSPPPRNSRSSGKGS